MTRLTVALACVLLGGCALGRSPMATTWVLDPVAMRAPSEGRPEGGVLSVERVRVPDWLDRTQFAARGQDGRIEFDEQARWGEPLGRGLQRVMTENLASLLTDRRVMAAPVPPRHAIAVRLTLDFVEAARQSAGDLRVEVRWELQAADGTPLQRGYSTSRIAAAKPGAAGTVAALNEALFKLATELSEVVRGVASM
ncbi:MAG: PqiC family protein [Vicinamibacteria bacterium]|nr:PqiC family protein [Vicinamibacteria bacterium]